MSVHAGCKSHFVTHQAKQAFKSEPKIDSRWQIKYPENSKPILPQVDEHNIVPTSGVSIELLRVEELLFRRFYPFAFHRNIYGKMLYFNS